MQFTKHIANIVGVGLGRPVLKLDVLFSGGASPAPTTFAINLSLQITIYLILF